MDKRIEFAFQFATVPKELKAVAEKYRDADTRAIKAEQQRDNWQREAKAASAEAQQLKAEFEKQLDAWDAYAKSDAPVETKVKAADAVATPAKKV